MNRRLFVSACMAFAVVLGWATLANAQDKKILFLTHSSGFKHGSLPVAEKTMVELGKKSKLFECTVLEGYKQEQKSVDLSILTPDYMNQFDAIMMFTTGELPLSDVQKKALIDFVKNGKAWIGAHSATDTLYTWKEYGELSGAYFKGHGPNHELLVLRVEDKTHPATKMLGDTWPLADEFYQYCTEGPQDRCLVPFSRERVRVLLSVDMKQSNLAPQRMDPSGDYPLAWCQNFGKGRAFYTALGHRDDVWTNLTFQAHLLGGIKWALGLEPGDATPSANKKSE
jgi:type 1 glutamine amidotransferase